MMGGGGLHLRSLTSFALAIVVLALSAVPARADGFITPFLGYNFGGDSANCASLTSCQEKHANFGVSVGSMGGVLGFEADIAYAKDFFGSVPGVDNNVFTAMANLVVSIPAGPVQPYVLGGMGLVRPHVSLNPTSISSDNNALGYDLGGGVNVFPVKHVGLRGDLRHFHTLQDVGVFRLNEIFTGEKLDYWRASVGLTLKF
jgi:opacity protein-like surface antigen